MRTLTTIFAVAVSLFSIAATAKAQEGQMSDSDYIAQALSAAPEAVAQGAAVVRAGKDGSMRTLRDGNNGFTCMIMGTDNKMCNDRNSTEFMHAVMTHMAPPNQMGTTRMREHASQCLFQLLICVSV